MGFKSPYRNWTDPTKYSRRTFESFRNGRHLHLVYELSGHTYYGMISSKKLLRRDRFAKELKKYPNYFLNMKHRLWAKPERKREY